MSLLFLAVNLRSSFCTTRDNTKKSGFNICGVARTRAWYSYITINSTCRSRFCRLVHIFKEYADTVMLALLTCPCIVEQSHSSENMPRTDIISQTQPVLELQNDEKKPRKSSKLAGKVLLGVTGAAAVGLVLVTTPFVTPALRKICLPYVPATERQITNVLHMAQGVKGQGSKLVDLGSGDGRVVIAAARQGYKAHGYELNQWLVWYSRLQARLQGLNKRATFSRADLWKVKLTTYDTIVIFGVSEMMQRLQDKFQGEMKDDARVLACRFPLPNWKPTQVVEEGIDSVWLYHKPKP